MRYPEFLPKNGTIGFVAPSFGCSMEPYQSAFRSAVEKLKSRGFQCRLGPNCFEDKGLGISNTPELCAKELNDFYLSDDCDVLISCGGGELMCEILPYLDFAALAAAQPKYFMGYSDNANFSFLLTTLCDTAAIYGPNAGAFGMEVWHPSVEDALLLLTGEKLNLHNYHGWERESLKDEERPLVPYQITEPYEQRIYTGTPLTQQTTADLTVEGRLLGGCLDVLDMLVGTRFDQVAGFAEKYQNDGIIWFLESCDLNPLQVRRALWQLREAGWFKNVKAFLIGRPLHFGEEVMGLDQYRAVTDTLGEFGVPVLMDVDLGHLPPMLPLITGSLARIKAGSNHLTIEMECR